MMETECVRCGMCCIIAPCGVGEEIDGVCEHLVVCEDLTTKCKIIKTLGFIGSGCLIRSSSTLLKIHEETYDITSIKESILKKGNTHEKAASYRRS